MADALAEIPPKEGRRRSKRSRGSPTGRTPRQEKESNKCSEEISFSSSPREPLSDTSWYVPMSAWTAKETKALVEFMLFHNPGKWESTKDSKFWTSASTFVRDRAEYSLVRTGEWLLKLYMVCARVVAWSVASFPSPHSVFFYVLRVTVKIWECGPGNEIRI